VLEAAIEATGRAARFTLRILLGRPALPADTGREGQRGGDTPGTPGGSATAGPPEAGAEAVPEVPDPRTSTSAEGTAEGTEPSSDMCPALRQLVRLGGELAAAGVDAQIRRDLHALAVPTVKPGTYIWIYPDAARQRFLCYLNDLCEHLTGDPRTAARDIAAFARAGRYRRARRHVNG
jgi:hypothetical protein